MILKYQNKKVTLSENGENIESDESLRSPRA